MFEITQGSLKITDLVLYVSKEIKKSDKDSLMERIENMILKNRLNKCGAHIEKAVPLTAKGSVRMDFFIPIEKHPPKDLQADFCFEVIDGFTIENGVCLYIYGEESHSEALVTLMDYLSQKNLAITTSVYYRIIKEKLFNISENAAMEIWVGVAETDSSDDDDENKDTFAQEAFESAKSYIKTNLSHMAFEEYIKPLRCEDISCGGETTVILTIADELSDAIPLIESKYLMLLKKGFRYALGGKDAEIAIYSESDFAKEEIYIYAIQYLDSRLDSGTMKEYIDILIPKCIDIDNGSVILAVPKLHAHKLEKIKSSFLPTVTFAFRDAMDKNDVSVEILMGENNEERSK